MFEFAVSASLLLIVGTFIFLNVIERERRLRQVITPLYDTHDPQFLRSLDTILGPPLSHGNCIQTLVNGNEIFPSMLEAIRNATTSITLETYIYWSDAIGNAFAEALMERARAGVRVHVLVDWFGSYRMRASHVRSMKAAGIEVKKYRPLHWYTWARINRRTHRKILVIDGRIGFIGGVGIADPWDGNAQDAQHWHDIHFKLEGPVVGQLQSAFIENWRKTCSVVLHGNAYFPEPVPCGNVRSQIFKSSSHDGNESLELLYLLSFSAARKHIRIGSPYFVPDRLCQRALIQAARRGVRVEVIVPGPHTDIETVRKASSFRWGRLLRNGIRIYEYQPTMYHCKLMVIDDCWSSVGSVNFDSRSFQWNEEANVNVYDTDFAEELTNLFELDKRVSRLVTYAEWRRRSWKEKSLSSVADMFSSQL